MVARPGSPPERAFFTGIGNLVPVQEFGRIAFSAIVLREEDLTILALPKPAARPLKRRAFSFRTNLRSQRCLHRRSPPYGENHGLEPR